jgi:hypothetical protein
MWLFGFPSICECVHNWLDNPINLLCRWNGLFDGVEDFGHITALLLSFRLFALHVSSNFVFSTARIFTPFFTPFFAFFPAGAKRCGIVNLVEMLGFEPTIMFKNE